jgi:hypothetical protein
MNMVSALILFAASQLGEAHHVCTSADEFLADERGERIAQRARELAEADDELIVDGVPGLVAILTPCGEVDVVNHQLVEYYRAP